MPDPQDFRASLQAYLLENARPRHKYGHQPRLYALAARIGSQLGSDPAGDHAWDDDIVFAAAWLHDLGVFVGHRPEDPALLVEWDHVAYTTGKAPALLRSLGFPGHKIDAVLEVIRTHQPHDTPTTLEATLVRDADILEQLGAIGILRTASKVGNDTRFSTFGDARRSLVKALDQLPPLIRLAPTRTLAAPRIAILRSFLAALDAEGGTTLE